MSMDDRNWMYFQRNCTKLGLKIQFNIHKVAMHISISLLEFRDHFQGRQRTSDIPLYCICVQMSTNKIMETIWYIWASRLFSFKCNGISFGQRTWARTILLPFLPAASARARACVYVSFGIVSFLIEKWVVKQLANDCKRKFGVWTEQMEAKQKKKRNRLNYYKFVSCIF